MEESDDRSTVRPPWAGLGPAWAAAAVTALVVAAGAVVVGLRAANEGAEPEGQNWWLVAWLVTGLTYSLAGVLLVTRPGRRAVGSALAVVGASSLVVALAVQYRGYEATVPGPPRWPWLADADTWARPLAAAVLVAVVPGALLLAARPSSRRPSLMATVAPPSDPRECPASTLGAAARPPDWRAAAASTVDVVDPAGTATPPSDPQATTAGTATPPSDPRANATGTVGGVDPVDAVGPVGGVDAVGGVAGALDRRGAGVVVMPPSDRWVEAVVAVALAATGVLVVASAVSWSGVEAVAAWVVAGIGLVWIAVLALSWWRGRGAAGDPLAGWLLAGAVVAWLAVVPSGLDLVDWSLAGHDVVWAVLLIATVPLLVVGALIGELRRVPSDAEQLSHRGLEWALFAAGIVVIYTVIVAGLGRLVGGSGPTWLLVAATGAIALAIEPARRRIRQLVDRLVFGSRDDALAVVQRIVDQVGTDTGDDLLPALVRSLDRGLRFDAIAIDLAVPGGGWERAASVGGDTAHRREVVLNHRDEVVGRLVVGWDDAAAMRTREADMLDQLAGPLSLAVSWVRLAADLRRSSLAVVSAREEERRRLRRDLHDGVGPTLTGVSLGLRTAVRQLDRATAAGSSPPSPALLARMADEVDGVVHEIKRIVRDLRPTALDQLGLTGAVAEFSRRFSGDLDIRLSLPEAPAPLPAAVEVAAYRIVTEALTNVVRHAHAERCWVRIVTDDPVEIDVIDDGIGIDHQRSDGVGLTAMRERAAELGGAVEVVRGPRSGTHLHVRLPAALP